MRSDARREIDLGLAVLSASELFRGVPLSAEVIAAACSCSRERIRQIEQRALRKLRNRLGEESAREALEILISGRMAAAKKRRVFSDL